MAVKAETGIRIVTEEDIKKIRWHHERELARVFLDRKNKNPNFEITYEPIALACEWKEINKEGIEVTVQRGTLPDFYVWQSDRPHSGVFVEATRCPQKAGTGKWCSHCELYEEVGVDGNGSGIRICKKKKMYDNDTKGKQKRVMNNVIPEDRLIVFYEDNLENIQKKYKRLGLNFFYEPPEEIEIYNKRRNGHNNGNHQNGNVNGNHQNGSSYGNLVSL